MSRGTNQTTRYVIQGGDKADIQIRYSTTKNSETRQGEKERHDRQPASPIRSQSTKVSRV